jgi:hypothetical protein
MANSASHAALPYPIRQARFTVGIGYLDADGDPTDPTTPDTEISKDGGTFADNAEEVTTVSGTNGTGIITLSGAEMDCSIAQLAAKVASGPKASLIPDIRPQVLGILYSGTATAGAAGSITLATDVPAIAKLLIGCIVRTTGGTGAGGTGGANNQARVITAFSTGRVATVVPNWEVTTDATTTYEILVTERSLFRAADLAMILGDDATVTRLERALNTETLVVVGTASTTTNIVTSSVIPTMAITDQFKGKALHFSRSTTTANLRGQSTRVVSNNTTDIRVVAMTTAPVSGDICIIT